MSVNSYVARLGILGLGIGVVELLRSATFIYSFRFEASHLVELFCYPLIFVLVPSITQITQQQQLRRKRASTIGAQSHYAEARSKALLRSNQPNNQDHLMITITRSFLTVLLVCAIIPFLYERLLLIQSYRVMLTVFGASTFGMILWWLKKRRIFDNGRFELCSAFAYCVFIDSDVSLARAIVAGSFFTNRVI